MTLYCKVKSGSKRINTCFVFKQNDLVNYRLDNGKNRIGRIKQISLSSIKIGKRNVQYSEIDIIQRLYIYKVVLKALSPVIVMASMAVGMNVPVNQTTTLVICSSLAAGGVAWAVWPINKYSIKKMKNKVLLRNEIPEFVKASENDTTIKLFRKAEREIQKDLYVKDIELKKERKLQKKYEKSIKNRPARYANFINKYGQQREHKIKLWLPYLFVNEYFLSYEMRVDARNSFEVGAGYLYDFKTFINKKFRFSKNHDYKSLFIDDFNHSMTGREGFLARVSYSHYTYRNYFIGLMLNYKYCQNGETMVPTSSRNDRQEMSYHYINQSEKSNIFGLDFIFGKQFIPWNRVSIDLFIGPGIKFRYGDVTIHGAYKWINSRFYYYQRNYPYQIELFKIYPDLQFGIKLGFAFGKKYKDYMK